MDNIQAAILAGSAVLAGGLIVSVLLFKDAIARAMAQAMIKVEQERQREAAAKDDRARQLLLNPWNKKGPAWNLTTQIERMRADFDGAVREAAEAGYDIADLRGHIDNKTVAVFIGDPNTVLPVGYQLPDPEGDQNSRRE